MKTLFVALFFVLMGFITFGQRPNRVPRTPKPAEKSVSPPKADTIPVAKPDFSMDWANNPKLNFCPGNFFQNGNFEIVTGNPNDTLDQDIHLATGWMAPWGQGSLADLHITGGLVPTGGMAPTPNSYIYAGMWIENRTNTSGNPTYREAMYNRLVSTIPKNSGSYSFVFNIANAMIYGANNNLNNLPVEIGIYGVFNPNNIVANIPGGANSNPTNLNIWQSANTSVQVVLLGVVTTPVPFTNTWVQQTITFNSDLLPSGGITHILVTAHDMARPSTYRKVYVNFDDFCMQIATPAASEYCCPGINLLQNGNFQQGNQGFSSQYSYNPTISTWATLPGQYNIVNAAQAGLISSGWIANNPHNCPNNPSGKFMAINGTTFGTGRKVVWEQTVGLKANECYKFCVLAKNLSQRDFDIKPKIDIEFSLPIGNMTQVISTSIDPCDWHLFEKEISPQQNSVNLTIKIYLDDSVLGDGNDVALANIALIRVNQCPKETAFFNTQIHSISQVGFQVTATRQGGAGTIFKDCKRFYWEVCELEPNSSSDPTTWPCKPGTQVINPQSWWTSPTSFPGYNFEHGKMYRIYHGVWGDCHCWNESQVFVLSSISTRSQYTFTEEELKKRGTSSILKLLK